MIKPISKRLKNKWKEIVEKGGKEIIRRCCASGFYFSYKGLCPCCSKEVTFESFDSWLRDSFTCPNCFSLPRERALMVTLEKYFPNWRNLKIHESSPGNYGSSLRLKNDCRNYISTQYYPNQTFGAIIDGNRNEDLENQTFPDAAFDIVITQDVMEHIYHPEKAFAEIARTLKNGGAHIFTVPIINKHNKTERWAYLGQDGRPVFIKTPEYHSNPVDPEGSPVTMHWGFDIVGFIKKSSGLNTTIIYTDNLYFGIRAEFIEVLVSEK